MKKNYILIMVFAILFFVVSCGPGSRLVVNKTRKSLLKLKIGMSKEDVLTVMDEPFKTEAYKKNGKQIDYWFYLTQRGSWDDSNFTPLAFENGILQGWGRNYYDDAIRIKQRIKEDITIKKN